MHVYVCMFVSINLQIYLSNVYLYLNIYIYIYIHHYIIDLCVDFFSGA